jgi:hypothetical protein
MRVSVRYVQKAPGFTIPLEQGLDFRPEFLVSGAGFV